MTLRFIVVSQVDVSQVVVTFGKSVPTCADRSWATDVPSTFGRVETSALAVILGAVLLASIVQGSSGLGFNLTSAPIIATVLPGSSAVGMVNLFALLQNAWLVTRERGRIRWTAFRVLGPSLAAGVIIGFLMVRLIPSAAVPILVALSALGSLAALLLWRAGTGRASGVLAGVWSGAINTYAGVGGPPVASYLIGQGWSHGDMVRTMQVVFIGIDIVSLPILGLPRLPWWFYGLAVMAIIAGSAMGRAVRGRLTHEAAVRLSQVVIAVAATASLIRSTLELLSRSG